jgi:N-methylhydantoinase A
MAGAIRLVSIERGHDPAKFVGVPFGGGGALHVGAIVKEIGLQRALVPRFPGVTSALGCVIADLRHDSVQTLNLALDGIDIAALDRRMVAAAEEVRAVVSAAGAMVDQIDLSVEFDMHYVGQTHTVAVGVPLTLHGGTTGISSAAIRTAFETAYAASFSRLLSGVPIRIVSLRVAATGRRPKLDLSVFAPGHEASVEKARLGTRLVRIDGAWLETRIWSRLDLPVDTIIEAPAILEQPDATIYIEPGLRGRVDQLGNLIVERVPT